MFLLVTFFFQSCFGTIDSAEIIRQCSSATRHFVLLSKSHQRGSSHRWSDWSIRHCSRVIPTGSPFSVYCFFVTSLEMFCNVFLFSVCIGTQIPPVYGQKSKLKPGNLSSMLFTPKVASFSVRFGMWEGFQIQVSWWIIHAKMLIFQI